MLQYVTNIFTRLDRAGYGKFWDKNPEKTIKLIQEHLFPAPGKIAESQHLDYQKLLKKDVKAYIKLLCQEAVIRDKIKFKTCQDKTVASIDESKFPKKYSGQTGVEKKRSCLSAYIKYVLLKVKGISCEIGRSVVKRGLSPCERAS